MATMGGDGGRFRELIRSCRSRFCGVEPEGTTESDAIGWHHFDWTWQVIEAHAIEEQAAGKAYIGQKIAMTGRLFGQDACDVVTHHESRNADVAAEEPVLDLDDADIVTIEFVDERLEDLVAVVPGERARSGRTPSATTARWRRRFRRSWRR